MKRNPSPVTRRKVLAAPLAIATHANKGAYFCNAVPPTGPRLVHANAGEPSTLDPALLSGSNGDRIVSALLESLITLHPLDNQPAAALATHYHVESDGLRYTFFLRGHPAPRGTRLPNAGGLPGEFNQGHTPPPDAVPAKWSDGTTITAHDFVYAWRRLLNPKTGGPLGFYLAPIGNASEVSSGAKPPESLAARASDDLAFQFDLTAPSPNFLKLLWQPFLAAVPRHAVEAARKSGNPSSWTNPGAMIASGPFRLRDWTRYNQVIVVRNPHYWDASMVRLSEIVFLPFADETVNLHLYRSGLSQSMQFFLAPAAFAHAFQKYKDFHTSAAYRTIWYDLDIKQYPLDRLAVRYALTLATDRKAIASFLGGGQPAANGVVPPMPGYPFRASLAASINGRPLDLLAFNPQAARELLASEGVRGFPMELTVPIRNGSRELARIVQAQWRANLGVNLRLHEVEETTWEQAAINSRYRDSIEDSWTASYEDPYDFLVEFGPTHYVSTTWTDKTYNTALDAANRIANPHARSRALFECEGQILRAMPIIPIAISNCAYFQAPYVRGIRPNPFGAPIFKYAWIDRDWRAA